MRSSPENPAAIAALAEFGLGFPRMRRKKVGYLGLGNGIEETIAFHAALKRSEMGLQCETPGHFPKLLVRFLAANTISNLHFAPFQQSHISRQQNTLFRTRDGGELGIIREPVVPGVETEHAKIRRQPAQMPIQHKADVFDVNWFRVREHLDVIARRHLLGQYSIVSVHRHCGNFGMWNPDATRSDASTCR